MERISISELLILIQSCIKTFAKIEKIKIDVDGEQIQEFLTVLLKDFIEKIFEKRKEERQGPAKV